MMSTKAVSFVLAFLGMSEIAAAAGEDGRIPVPTAAAAREQPRSIQDLVQAVIFKNENPKDVKELVMVHKDGSGYSVGNAQTDFGQKKEQRDELLKALEKSPDFTPKEIKDAAIGLESVYRTNPKPTDKPHLDAGLEAKINRFLVSDAGQELVRKFDNVQITETMGFVNEVAAAAKLNPRYRSDAEFKKFVDGPLFSAYVGDHFNQYNRTFFNDQGKREDIASYAKSAPLSFESLLLMEDNHPKILKGDLMADLHRRRSNLVRLAREFNMIDAATERALNGAIGQNDVRMKNNNIKYQARVNAYVNSVVSFINRPVGSSTITGGSFGSGGSSGNTGMRVDCALLRNCGSTSAKYGAAPPGTATSYFGTPSYSNSPVFDMSAVERRDAAQRARQSTANRTGSSSMRGSAPPAQRLVLGSTKASPYGSKITGSTVSLVQRASVRTSTISGKSGGAAPASVYAPKVGFTMPASVHRPSTSVRGPGHVTRTPIVRPPPVAHRHTTPVRPPSPPQVTIQVPRR